MNGAREERNRPKLGPPTEELVKLSQADRDGAFGELYRRVAPAVYAWANLHIHRALRSTLDPEDLLQEVERLHVHESRHRRH